jgi:uncharacterized protein (DUF952 family)
MAIILYYLVTRRKKFEHVQPTQCFPNIFHPLLVDSVDVGLADTED